jgi:amidase
MLQFDIDQLRQAAQRLGSDIAEHERDEIVRRATVMARNIDYFTEHAVPLLPAPHVIPGRRVDLGSPSAKSDPLNAVIRWVDVSADADAVTSDALAGKRVGLKDLIAVAGIPTSAASHLLAGHVPREDAVVTERILKAGGRVVAMTNLAAMAFGGGEEPGIYGGTLNPFDHTRNAAGSSGGSAASLFYDGVDITLGTDQGGSIRGPASFCGVLGLKPTHALVPYTGIASHDLTIDHVGPLTRTAYDIALMMSVIAGPHASDPRQTNDVPADLPFLELVEAAPETYDGVTFGVLAESLTSDGTPEREAVLAAFAEAIARIEALGGSVVTVSVPEHHAASAALAVILLEGIAATLYGNGTPYGMRAGYAVDDRLAVHKGMAAFGSTLPPAYRTAAIVGELMRSEHGGTLYAAAQQIVPVVTAAYDAVLRDVDVIVMPTTPMVATPVPGAAKPIAAGLAPPPPSDPAAFDATGHPALSIPAAEVDGLPLGVTFVGTHFSDATLIGLARTWERAYGWFPSAAVSDL